MSEGVRGVVFVPDARFARERVLGVPLMLWAVVALRRALGDDAVSVCTDDVEAIELAGHHGVSVDRPGAGATGSNAGKPGAGASGSNSGSKGRASAEAPIVTLPAGGMFVRPDAVRRAAAAARTGAPVSALDHLEPAPGGVDRLVADPGDPASMELVRAVARGLAPDDERLRGIARARLPLAVRIDAVITDVDGVLTDGGISRGDNGEACRTFNIKDGLGTRLLIEAGIGVAWLSSGHTEGSIHARAQTLGVQHVDVGRGSKGPRLLALCERMGVSPANVLYVGDDALDLPAMEAAGLSACPCDAHASVRARTDLVLELPGGRGCFREVADLVLDGNTSR